jgi:hypothetical protein
MTKHSTRRFSFVSANSKLFAVFAVCLCVFATSYRSQTAESGSTNAQTAADYRDYLEASKKTGGNLEYLKKMPKQKLPLGKRQPKRGVPKDKFYLANVTITAKALVKTKRKR